MVLVDDDLNVGYNRQTGTVSSELSSSELSRINALLFRSEAIHVNMLPITVAIAQQRLKLAHNANTRDESTFKKHGQGHWAVMRKTHSINIS